MLDDDFVEELQGQAHPRKYFDGDGMYLYLQPSGAKYWRLKYRYNGKEKTYSMGAYPSVSLEEARQKTEVAKQQLKQGIDPSAFKQKQTFEYVAREWFDNEREGWKDRHAKIVINSLECDVFPYIGDRNVRVIRPPELLAVVKRIEKRGALQVATKVLQRIGAVFRYAVQTGRVSSNPATELSGVVKNRKVKHQTALPLSELPAFIQSVNNYSGMPSTRYAILLMLLTFVRTNELIGAKWGEFDLNGATWRLPESRTKKNRVHIVPLSKQAIALLKQLPSYNQLPDSYLFQGRQSSKPISSTTMLYAVYRMGYRGKATIHGLRGVASTVLNESGLFPVDVIERQLGHVEGNAVRRAYNHAQYIPERMRMMQWWADYLDDIQGNKKVGILKKIMRLRKKYI